MARNVCLSTPIPLLSRKFGPIAYGTCPFGKSQAAHASQLAVKGATPYTNVTEVSLKPAGLTRSPLARLPTSSILRSLFLSVFFTTPWLFRPGITIFSKIACTSSPWLNPDKNPVLEQSIRHLVYEQFCAGRDHAEIESKSRSIKQLGFSGVVLVYGKEVQVGSDSKLWDYEGTGTALEAEINEWKVGNLTTLDMVADGDWIGMKFSGAGLMLTNALIEGGDAPEPFIRAMDEICEKAAAKNSRIWIDAEQQALQPSIDRWTFDLMRKYNRGEKPLIYNTIQAYLKTARHKVHHQLTTAAEEGWRPAIKLVRGAYIENDSREKIHDTKPETDSSYNGIVEDLLRGRNFPIFESNPRPKFDLLLAGHNSYTIRRAARLATELAAQGDLRVVPEFAQLQGMADDIGCELVQMGEDVVSKRTTVDSTTFVPRVYKCLTWGSVQECMQYLARRLIENRGAADRMREGAAQLRQELRRRWFPLG